MNVNLKNLLLVLLIPAFLLSSCSKNADNVFEMVPETAMAVLSIHPGNLLEKGKLQEIEAIRNEASENEITKKILEDPESSGIEMNSYSTFFVFNHQGQFGCAVMPLKSKSDFKIFLKEVEEDLEIEFENGKIKSYETISYDDFILVFDNSIVMILSTMDDLGDENLNEIAEHLIDLDKEYTLKTDKDFNNFLSKQKDINLWFSTNNMGGIPGVGNMSGVLDMVGGVKNNYGHAFADFQNGSMTFSTNLRFNQTLQETIDQYNFLDENAIKDILKYLPSENLFFVGNTNVDPEKIFDLLKFVNKDFSNTIEAMAQMMGLEDDDLKNVFSGEIAFSLNGINSPLPEKENVSISSDHIPSIVFSGRINHKKSLEKFLSLAQEKAELKEKEGYYVVINKGIPVYLLVVQSDLIMSNNENIIRDIEKNGQAKENVTKSIHSENLTNNPICFYLNLDESTYTEEMQELFSKKLGKELEMGIKTFGSPLKSLSLSANVEEWDFKIELKDDSENSLYTLLNQADK